MRLAVVLACAVLVARPAPARAFQAQDHNRWARARWVGDLNFLAANALLGGVAAGVVSRLKSGSFKEGFKKGALGGGIVYLGKRTAAARFDGAGFLGREVGAVGASITRNAGLGVGLLDTLVLPVGPLEAVVTPHSPTRARFVLDLRDTYWIVYGLVEDHLTFDWGRSLSAGTAVFRTASDIGGGGNINGVTAGQTIILDRSADLATGDTFAHERVHVVQVEFFKTAVGLPAEAWLGRKTRLDRLPLFDRVQLGVADRLVALLLGAGLWGRSAAPVEVEAEFLEGR